MSNSFVIFFSFLFPTAVLFAGPLSGLQRNQLLQRADYLFQYEQFTEALATYDSLLADQYATEQMLYRMAFMAEEEAAYARSIFYLRRLQWEFGGELIEEKIQQLMEESSLERLSPGSAWSELQLWGYHHRLPLLMGLGGVTVLALVSLFWPAPPARHWLGIGLTLSGLLISLFWWRSQEVPAPRGVVLHPTVYYDLPGFGAEFSYLPISPGATVQLHERQDIWQKISMGQFEAWVPAFVVEEI